MNQNEIQAALVDALQWLDGITNPTSPIYIRGSFTQAAEDGMKVTIARGRNALKKVERAMQGGPRIATIGNDALSEAIESCDAAVVDVARTAQELCATARESSEIITFVDTEVLNDMKKACKDWALASQKVLSIVHSSGRIVQS